MSIELITGMGGTNHVDSEDVGALNAELIGNGNYLLSGCEVTMTDANTCHVAAGELLLQGRHVRIKGAGEDVSIGNGQAGYNQRYLICLVYSKATSGIETVGLQAFAGAKTTGAATDPAVSAGSILGGDTNVVVPLARLELTGLSVGTPAVMLDSVKGLAALGAETKKLGDSVSPKILVDGQIKSGESRTVHGISDWLMVGVYVSAAAGDSDDREMLVPCLVGDRFLLGSSGCAVDVSDPRYVSVRFSLNGEVLRYVNVTMQDTSNGNILNRRNANGIVGLIRR